MSGWVMHTEKQVVCPVTIDLHRITKGVSRNAGYEITWSYWARSIHGDPEVLIIDNWNSTKGSVPAWAVLPSLRYIHMSKSGITYDATGRIEYVVNGGVVPGSFGHDWCRFPAVTENVGFSRQ